MTYATCFFVKWWHQNKKLLLPFFACIYFLSELYYLLTRFDLQLADLTLYYKTAERITMGEIPYRDFRLEYPIFSIIPILLPGLFNILFGSTFEIYCVLFVFQNLLFAAATAIFLAKTKIDGHDSKAGTKYYGLLILIFMPVYLFRYDAFPAFLTSIIIFGIRKNSFLSGMIWVVATGAKLYPLVIGPVILFYYIINKDFKKIWSSILGIFLTILCTLTFTLSVIGPAIFDVFNKHKLRGIQIESVTGGVLLFLSNLKILVVTPSFNFGSININTPFTDIILNWIIIISPPIFLLLLFYFVKIILSEKRRNAQISQRNVIRACGLMILSFMILNKVLSPQYFIWLFPLMPFYSHSVKQKFIVTLILTISIFPGWYSYLIKLNSTIIFLLNIRNALLVWILVDILVEMAQSQNLIPYKTSKS